MTGPAATVHSAIPFKRDGASDSVLASSGAGILIVSLIAIAVMLVMRKRLRTNSAASGSKALLQVLETRRLGPRAFISVVEFKGTHYLLAQNEQSISCINSSSSAPAGEPQ